MSHIKIVQWLCKQIQGFYCLAVFSMAKTDGLCHWGFLILTYSAPADPHSAQELRYTSTPLVAHVSQVSANVKEREGRRNPQDFLLWDNWIVLKPVWSKWHKLPFLAWEMTSSLLYIYFIRSRLLLLPRHLKANRQKAPITIPSYCFPNRT